MMNDFIRVFIELHPQFHLHWEAAPNIPGLCISLAFFIHSPAIPRPPLEPEDIPQEHNLCNRFGIHVCRRVAVIKNGFLVIAQDNIKISASGRHS